MGCGRKLAWDRSTVAPRIAESEQVRRAYLAGQTLRAPTKMRAIRQPFLAIRLSDCTK